MVKKIIKKVIVKKEKKQDKRYFEAKGRRKTSVARVRLSNDKKGIIINEKDYKQYFPILRLQKEVESPLEVVGMTDKLGAEIRVSGGGLSGQAGAVKHGIARALVVFNEELRKSLRKNGLLTRDSRMVERKKYGLRKARRAPQWAKR